MTDRILALVDGSIYAKSVCEHGAWAAGRTGLGIELLHVLGRREAPDRHDLSGAIALGARSALLEELSALDEQRSRLARARGRAILDDAGAILGQAGIRAVTSLRRGDLLDEVTGREPNSAMILIGKRGEAADFAKGHLGSNVERVIRAARKPVLVASRAFRPIERLLVAYDGGPSAKRAIEHVASSPLYAGVHVTVATVGSPSGAVSQGLNEARAALLAVGIEAETRTLAGEPDQVLGRLIEAEGFDMLVMGAHGQSRIRALIIGSITSEMIRSCRVPVMLIR